MATPGKVDSGRPNRPLHFEHHRHARGPTGITTSLLGTTDHLVSPARRNMNLG
jgi:hypothetical protein